MWQVGGHYAKMDVIEEKSDKKELNIHKLYFGMVRLRYTLIFFDMSAFKFIHNKQPYI